MNGVADWMVVTGFLLAGLGVVLRVVILMRSSDAHPPNDQPRRARDLYRAFRAGNPTSPLPTAMWTSVSAGLVLLIAGFLLELR